MNEHGTDPTTTVKEKNAEAIALVRKWMNEPGDYDERTWPVLDSALRGSRCQNVTDSSKWDEQPTDPVWNAVTMSVPAFVLVAAVLVVIVLACVLLAAGGCQ